MLSRVAISAAIGAWRARSFGDGSAVTPPPAEDLLVEVLDQPPVAGKPLFFVERGLFRASVGQELLVERAADGTLDTASCHDDRTGVLHISEDMPPEFHAADVERGFHGLLEALE
jgi:hypothetical protein